MNRLRRHGGITPYLLVGPAVIGFLLFTIAPVIYALWLSFHNRQITGGGILGGQSVEVFTGLSNYQQVLQNPEFLASIRRMLTVAVIGVPGTLIFACVFALCLDADRARLTGATRILIFLPYAVPGVIASLLWGFMYLPATSPIGGNTFDFFGNNSVFFSVANIAVWSAVGFNMLILYTALRGLPPEIYESARLDGASEFDIAWHIKLPLIRPALLMCGLFSMLGALQLFNEPATLQPLANVITSSWVPLMNVHNIAFTQHNIYLAAAQALFIATAIILLTIVVNQIVARTAASATAPVAGTEETK